MDEDDEDAVVRAMTYTMQNFLKLQEGNNS